MKVANRHGSPRARSGHDLRVVIVEPEPLYGELLRFALAREDRIIVRSAASAGAALAGARNAQPDVYLIGDPSRGPISATSLGKRLRAIVPDVGVVILADAPRWTVLEGLTEEDLRGWCVLLRTSAVHLETLVSVMRAAASGRVMMNLAPVVGPGGQRDRVLQRLTHYQRQVLWLVSEGYTNEGIAERLGVSERSVESSVYRIYATLGIGRDRGSLNARVQAAKLAFDLLPPAAGEGHDA